MSYAEFPADEIIDVHFKKPEDPGNGNGGAGTLCGEWGYEFPGRGFYAIYHDGAPPEAAGGKFQHILSVIPYRIKRELIRTPDRVMRSPRDEGAQAWSTFKIYLLGGGIFLNPYGDVEMDRLKGVEPLVIGARAYEIDFSNLFVADPPPAGFLVNCNFLGDHGTGLGMANKKTDPAFNIFDPVLPTAPNYGPTPITYDLKADGQGILLTMGYVNITTMCDNQEWLIANCVPPGSCYAGSWSNNTHLSIRAIC